MRCAKMEELLSAYANGELSDSQREMVEAHLSQCARCKQSLADFKVVRQQLSSHKVMPDSPDILSAVMPQIGAGKSSPGKPRKWLRPALVAVPLAVILIALSVLQPWSSFPSPQTIMAQAYEATERLQSYRTWCEYSLTTYKGETSKTTFESEFAAPDRYHVKMDEDGRQIEVILIDKRLFRTNDVVSRDTGMALLLSAPSFINRETTLKMLEYLIDVEKLSDEKLEGVDCFHYRGKFDIDRQLEEIKDSLNPAEVEQMRQTEQYAELWIGKEDYLIRQSERSYQLPAFMRNSQLPAAELGQMDDYTLIIKNYDFNQAITIEPPLTASGELLPGWEEIYNSSFSQPALSGGHSISIIDDESNPGHKKINFRFFIGNNHIEVANNVRVFVITTMTTSDPDNPVTVELEPSVPVPINLKQFEQEIFTGSLEYDFSESSKVEVDKLQSTTTVVVKYLTPYGDEKVEQLYPDTRYPAKTPSATPPRE